MSEDLDMNTLQATFDRVLATVREYTNLTTEVRTLRTEVNGVKQELDTMRHTNRWLDEQIVSLRSARDQALNELSNVAADRQALEGEVRRLSETNENQRQELQRLNQLVASLRQEKDEAYGEWRKSDEELEKHKGKLAAIQQVFASVNVPLVQPRNNRGEFLSPKIEPTVEPPTSNEPVMVQAPPEATPESEAEEPKQATGTYDPWGFGPKGN